MAQNGILAEVETFAEGVVLGCTSNTITEQGDTAYVAGGVAQCIGNLCGEALLRRDGLRIHKGSDLEDRSIISTFLKVSYI